MFYPCHGLLVPAGEALELLRFRNVTCPMALQMLREDLAESEDQVEHLTMLVELERARALAHRDAAESRAQDAGHSTWTVVAWTIIGVAIGAGGFAAYTLTR